MSVDIARCPGGRRQNCTGQEPRANQKHVLWDGLIPVLIHDSCGSLADCVVSWKMSTYQGWLKRKNMATMQAELCWTSNGNVFTSLSISRQCLLIKIRQGPWMDNTREAISPWNLIVDFMVPTSHLPWGSYRLEHFWDKVLGPRPHAFFL